MSRGRRLPRVAGRFEGRVVDRRAPGARRGPRLGALLAVGVLGLSACHSAPTYTPSAAPSSNPAQVRREAVGLLDQGLNRLERAGHGRFQMQVFDGGLHVTESGRYSLDPDQVVYARHLDTGRGQGFDVRLIRTPDRTFVKVPGASDVGRCWITGAVPSFAKAAAFTYDLQAGPYPPALLALGDAHALGFDHYDRHTVRGTLDFERVLALISPTAPAVFHVVHGAHRVPALFQLDDDGTLVAFSVTARDLDASAEAAGMPRGAHTFAPGASVQAVFATVGPVPRALPRHHVVTLRPQASGRLPTLAYRTCGTGRVRSPYAFYARGGLG